MYSSRSWRLKVQDPGVGGLLSPRVLPPLWGQCCFLPCGSLGHELFLQLQGPSLCPHFTLITALNIPPPNAVLGSWGLGLQHMTLRETIWAITVYTSVLGNNCLYSCIFVHSLHTCFVLPSVRFGASHRDPS